MNPWTWNHCTCKFVWACMHEHTHASIWAKGEKLNHVHSAFQKFRIRCTLAIPQSTPCAMSGIIFRHIPSHALASIPGRTSCSLATTCSQATPTWAKQQEILFSQTAGQSPSQPSCCPCPSLRVGTLPRLTLSACPGGGLETDISNFLEIIFKIFIPLISVSFLLRNLP